MTCYGIEAQTLLIFYKRVMQIYAMRGEVENAFAAFEKAAKYAVYMDTFDQNVAHTSLLFKGRVLGGYYKNYPDESYARELLEAIDQPLYSGIRAHSQFAAIKA